MQTVQPRTINKFSNKSSQKHTVKPSNAARAIPNTRKQKGVSMVFCALFVPVMGIAIILISNVTQLVLEKVRLQQTVDQAALAAATIQSIGMNNLADLNFAAEEEIEVADEALNYGVWSSFTGAATAIQYHQEIFTNLQERRSQANTEFAKLAHEYAQYVVESNLPNNPDILPIQPLNGASNAKLVEYIPRPNEEGPIEFSSYLLEGCTQFSCNPSSLYSKRGAPTDLAVDHASQRSGWSGLTFSIGSPVTLYFYPPIVKWQKIESIKTYAAYRLTQRKKRYAIGPNFLSNFFPEITVYAAAKPTGGHLFEAEPEYVPRMVHLRDGNLTPPPQVPNLGKVNH